MIKILFLIDKLVPAGTQTNLLEIVKRLDRNRFEPHVIALVEGDEFIQEFEAIGIEPIILHMKKVFGPSGLKALSFLIRYLKEEKIDIVQTHFLQADILGSLAGKYVRVQRIITTRRDEGFWRTKRQLGLNRYFNRFMDRVLVNSQAVKEAVRVKEEVSSRKIHVIYNGVDLKKYFPLQELREQARRELGIEDDEFVVGMVANMRHEVKGHRFLLKAISLLKKEEKKVKLMLVGDGPLETRIENYAASRNVLDQIFFLGSRRDVPALVNAMDVVCVPSLSEGFSNTVLEAMAIGKPLIATNVGGNSEVVVHGETGFLVRPRDGVAISEKLIFFIENREACSEMGAAGLKKVQSQFTIEKMIQEYEEFYVKLLEVKERRRASRKEPETVSQTKIVKVRTEKQETRASSVSKREDDSKTSSVVAPRPAPSVPPRQSRRVRVMYLIWSLDLGGAEQVVMNLAKKLDRQKFKAVVCCLNEKGRYAPLLEKEGIKVFELHKKPKFDLFLIFKLVGLIKQEKIDLLHTHLFSSNLWGRIAADIANIPVVSTEHNVDTWKGKFHFFLDRLLVNKNKRIIFVSEKVKEFYEEKGLQLDGKAKVLYNGIDTSHFTVSNRSSNVREKFGISRDAQVLGIVGRLVPQKAHVDFIEAVQQLKQRGKNVAGLIVGDGPLRKELEERVKKNGLESSIIFAGFSNDMTEFYQAMDVFVLCSLREGFPMTILEAMASGVPVVATNVGGVSECVTDGEHGLLVAPENPTALAEAISKIFEDSLLKERLIQNALRRVRDHFNIETMTAEHEQIYREVLRVPREA